MLMMVAMRGRRPISGPVRLHVVFFMPCTKQRKRVRKPAPRKWYEGKKDLSNMVKAIEDAMNEVVWHDDRQVVTMGRVEAIECAQGEEPRTAVMVEPLEDFDG